MGFYIGFVTNKRLLAKEGSFYQVVDWGQSILEDNPVIKIARLRPDGPSCKVIADLTREGITYARTPRRISRSGAKKLCRSARINR